MSYDSLMSTGAKELERYERMKGRVADYTSAIVGTNLAVRCWARRVGSAGLREESYGRSLVLVWLLTNHILQLAYRRAGVDVMPEIAGREYGHGFSVVRAASCRRNDVGVLGGFTFGSVTLRPAAGSTAQNSAKKDQLAKAIAKGEDPLWAVDRAADIVLGTRWLKRCRAEGCTHREDDRPFLIVSSIVTLALALGQVELAVLGPEIDPRHGHVLYAPRPVAEAYLAAPKKLYANWFEIGRAGQGPTLWIDRRSGVLTRKNGSAVPFDAWAKSDVDIGLKTLVELLGG
jgi:hypothetical protein